jgi:serine/threonine protein kinase
LVAEPARAMSTPPGPENGEFGGWAQLSDLRLFGKYLLVRKLAEGGMAEIFLAKQIGPEGFERDVVIKRMLKQLSDSPEFVAMFLDEARIAARLVHQNIVHITDLGQADGQYFLCMEYLPGEDLTQLIDISYLRQEPIPAAVASRIMLGACEGLEFAHSFEENGRPLKIVHRDVTPSNILVTYQGTVKLVDFGIAKAETKVAKTGLGTVKGKWVYMSPEQARGDTVDRRSDVFSLGLTFYELLTGDRVFQRENELAILKALLTAAIANPRKFRPDLPDALIAILGRALTREVEKRYQSAGAMAHDLESFLATAAPGTGTKALAQYMVGLFGKQRMELKSHIPTLKALAQMGVAIPALDSGFPKTFPSVSSPLASGPSADAKEPPPETSGAQAPVAGEVDGRAGRRSRGGPPPGQSRAIIAAAAAGTVATAAAAGLFLSSRSPPLPPSTPPAAPADIEEATSPDRDAGPADRGFAPSDAGPPQARESPRPAAPPQQLTAPVIAAHVARHRARLLGCFERHRSDLPAQRGTVNLTFTILRSGQVSEARVSTPGFESSPLSGCIVEQIKAIRFPRHTEQAVTLNLPFVFSVKEEG